MAVTTDEIEQALHSVFPNAEIALEDYAGDGDHYKLIIKDASFIDVPLVKQHKMVKDALAELLEERLHAITIKTLCP